MIRVGRAFFSATVVAALAVCGHALAGEPLEDAVRGTARITEGSSSATAFVVDLGEEEPEGRRFALVSAAHVFEEMEGQRCTLHFRAPDAENGFVRRETELRFRDDDGDLWTQHVAADVAAIFIELPSDVDVEPFELDQVADEAFFEAGKLRTGQDVYIPCFPAKVESNAAGFPILRKGSVASYPLKAPLVGDSMLIDYSHFGGDSGAPVTAIVEDEPKIVGLAMASLRQTDRSSTEYEERTIHTPLGLAIVVRSVLILETLDELKRTP